MLAEAVGIAEIFVVFIYLFIIVYLGWLGYTQTKTAVDYLIAGCKVHPFIMAVSYGATFISTSAIVGFGGLAGLFGMSLLWLTLIAGFAATSLWLVFVKAKEAEAIGLVKHLTGGQIQHPGGLSQPNWPVVDPIMVALPISVIVIVVVSLFTKPLEREHLDKCFS